MCGISGFIDFDDKSSEEFLRKMNHQIQHRGPDGQGYYFQKHGLATIGLAHKRLSILDLSLDGAQPMQFEHLIISFNGEMYNFTEVKEELNTIGHIFNGSGDTEVLLHAIDEWGMQKALGKFRGMFAFCLLDTKKNLAYLVRDRVGIKPLYVYQNNNLILFGSELKVLCAHPNFKKEINHRAVALYFKYAYIPTPYSIYKDTSKIQCGHYLEINLNSYNVIERKYWDAKDAFNKPKLALSDQEIEEQTHKLLEESIALRLVSDVPVGIFLSGGYDSSLVTAIAKKQIGNKELKTFTIGFEDKSFNEATYAKDIANLLGTNHYEAICGRKEALDLVEEIPTYFDEPFGDQSSIPTMLLSAFARKEVKVSLSADAGDELFAGYNKYDQLKKFDKIIGRIPKLMRGPLAKLINQSFIKKMIYIFNSIPQYELNYKINKLTQLLNASDSTEFNDILNQKYFSHELPKLLKTYDEYNESRNENKHLPLLEQALLSDYQNYLTNDIMTKVDRASMRSSLEGREPFLDHKLYEYVAQIPIKLKFSEGIKKRILKRITYKYIPKKLLDRPKKGFGIPLDHWMREHFRKNFLELTTPEYLHNQNIFNIERITELSNNFFIHNNEKAERIWLIYIFQLWHEKWMK